MVMPIVAASETPTVAEQLVTTMTTAFTEVQTNVMSMITASLPIALGIVGTVLAITIGVGIFKKITAKA